MNTAMIVQARMTSTRLPGKVMKTIENKPMLELLIERLRYSQKGGRIIIAVTQNKEDDVICELCQKLSIDYFRGQEDDVLDRYYQCARQFKVNTIVRITSDCPVIDPEIIDAMLARYFEMKDSVDYFSNIEPVRTFPRGLDVEIFPFRTLEKCWKEATAKPDREHVCSYIYMHPEIFRIYNFTGPEDNSGYRWTVDTPEDLELIKEIYRSLYRDGNIFLYADILELFRQRPELARINCKVRQKKYGE